VVHKSRRWPPLSVHAKSGDFVYHWWTNRGSASDRSHIAQVSPAEDICRRPGDKMPFCRPLGDICLQFVDILSIISKTIENMFPNGQHIAAPDADRARGISERRDQQP
jgi:hypothetical protein